MQAAGLDLRLQVQLATSLQVGGFQVARYLTSDAAVFWNSVREVENDPLFRELWRGHGQRAIRIVPRRGGAARVPPKAAAALAHEVESLLEDFGTLVTQLRTLGRDAFSALFLDDNRLTLAEAAEISGASLDELERFQRAVLDRVAIVDAVHGPPAATSVDASCSRPGGTLEAIGQVEARDGHLHLNMFFDRVRYLVDDGAVQALQRQGLLDSAETARWSDLRRKLTWINIRFTLVNRVVEAAATVQAPYLLSCREEDRAVLEMKQVAASLGVHPSWVCRVIAGKSLLAPSGEIPLRSLFQERRRDQKANGIRRLRDLLAERGDLVTDRELQMELEARGVAVARRTVNFWRREIMRNSVGLFFTVFFCC